MDEDMDIDLVIEEEDPEIARMKAAAQAELERATAAEAASAMNGVEEDGEVNPNDAVPTKVHIRGLDSLTTNDIKAFLKEHYSDDDFKRVEWIDDTSANLIFDNEQAASEALAALSQEDVADVLTLRSAKASSTHPNTQLEVRQAIAADVKLPGAKDRSRFYLMNPEYDPETRALNRKRRYEDGDRSYNKRRREDRRGRSPEPAQYSADMYDDSTGTGPTEAEVKQKRTQMEDLFRNRKPPATLAKPDKSRDGRLRDRSASPISDGEGKYGFEETQPRRKTARLRSSTPPHLRVARPRDYGDADRKYREYEARRLTVKVNRGRELFPDKNHKRSDAQDLKRDKVADIIGDDPKGKGDLFSRVSYPGERRQEGFSFLGASKERVENPLVRELFPMKTANAGKELFETKIKGRAARNRAEDLF